MVIIEFTSRLKGEKHYFLGKNTLAVLAHTNNGEKFSSTYPGSASKQLRSRSSRELSADEWCGGIEFTGLCEAIKLIEDDRAEVVKLLVASPYRPQMRQKVLI